MSEDKEQSARVTGMPGEPNGYFLVIDSRRDEEELISLAEFWRVTLRSWRFLAILAVIGAGIAAGIGLIMKPVFRADTVLAPVEAPGSSVRAGLRGQLGGLAALAGLDAQGGVTSRAESIATLTSKGFAREFIVGEDLLPVLYADRWDPVAKKWKAGEKAPRMEDAVKMFTEKVRFLGEDRLTGIVTLSVEWYSAELASEWANKMVQRVNLRMRESARQKAERSIEFLNREVAKSNVVPLQQAVFRLIEEQVNNAMLANVQQDYAFRVLDPAVPPVIRARPKRTMMTLVGGVVGGFVGVLWVLVRTQQSRRRPRGDARA